MYCIDEIQDIAIGRLMDNETKKVDFDLSRWIRDYPQLTGYHVEVISPAGVEYLAARVRRENNVLSWTITNADTATAGRGSYKIVGLGENGERKSSATGILKVAQSMPGFVAGQAPEPMRPYVEEVVKAAERAEEAARRAEAAAGGGGGGSGGGGGDTGGGGLTELPVASATRLGGVKVGENLRIDGYGLLSVDTADYVEQDNTRPITAAAVHATVGNINALLETI